MIPSIPELTRQLARLHKFEQPQAKKEQYSTPPEIAAEAIHYAAELGDIIGKKVSDLGAGTGILGIGALIARADHCTFVEQDPSSTDILRENVSLLPSPLQKYTIRVGIIQEFTEKSETIVMNPPFGTKEKHADKPFFECALRLAPVIYAFAKTTTHRFVEKISADHGYAITHAWRFDDWRLAATQHWHRKRATFIDVTLYRIASTKSESFQPHSDLSPNRTSRKEKIYK